MSHPIATLRFVSVYPTARFEPFERHWYHVPRVGDKVEIDMEGDGAVIVRGKVYEVIWDDHGATVELA